MSFLGTFAIAGWTLDAVTHEMIHAIGIENEAMTECFAMQISPLMAYELGVPATRRSSSPTFSSATTSCIRRATSTQSAAAKAAYGICNGTFPHCPGIRVGSNLQTSPSGSNEGVRDRRVRRLPRPVRRVTRSYQSVALRTHYIHPACGGWPRVGCLRLILSRRPI
jgi:hypothetical protein